MSSLQIIRKSETYEVIKSGNKLIKIWKSLSPDLLFQINSEIEFLKKYSHPMIIDLLDYKVDEKNAILEYAFFPGETITVFLKKHPQYSDILWQKLINFVRYLKYKDIFIGDFKPEHILVSLVDDEPTIKIIDITPHKDVLTIEWAAPEQQNGILNWKSNLFTLGLIFASLEVPESEIREMIENDEIVAARLPYETDVTKICSKNPVERLDNLDKYYFENCKGEFSPVNLQYKYNSFIEFHQVLMDSLCTTKISFRESYGIYKKYNAGVSATRIKNLRELRNFSQSGESLNFILANEVLRWNGNTIVFEKNNLTETESVLTDIKLISESLKAFKIKGLYKSINALADDTGKLMNLDIDDALQAARIIYRNGFFQESEKFLTNYFSKNNPKGEDYIKFWITWITIHFHHSGEFNNIFIQPEIKGNSELDNFLSIINNHFSNNLESIEDIAQSGDCRYRKLAYFILNNYSKDKYDFINEALESSGDIFDVIDMLSSYYFHKGLYDANAWTYILTLALEFGSDYLLYKCLVKLLHVLDANRNTYLANSITHVLGEVIPQERTAFITSKVIEMYYKQLKFGKLADYIEKYVELIPKETLPSALVKYMEISISDKKLKLSQSLVKLIKQQLHIIKKSYGEELNAVLFSAKHFLNEERNEYLYRLLRTNLDEQLNPVSELNRLQDDFSNKEYHLLVELTKYDAQNEYIAGENSYFAGLSLIELGQKQRSSHFFSIALTVFNRLGLFNRCLELSSFLEREQPAVSKESLDYMTIISRIIHCRDLKEIQTVLSEIVYMVFDYEKVITFIYDSNIKNFTPIVNITEDYNEGMEAIHYSSQIMATYKRNLNRTFSFNTSEDNMTGSIHRLQIKNALCVPMIVGENLIGTIYIHTRQHMKPLSEQKVTHLETIASLTGIVVDKLFRQKTSIATDDLADFHGIVGSSRIMSLLKKQIISISSIPYAVLISGESGVGKELVARALYKEGSQKGELIIINSTTIPRELFESELFGHKKGSFSGAHEDKKGFIESAENGTLFFDEIGELPLELQPKLLRLLQERTFTSVGDTTVKTTNTRFVFATNRNLEEEVKSGRFRKDLYARIRQFQINVPPLREHTEDIPVLVDHFTVKFIKTNPSIDVSRIPRDQVTQWQHQEWSMNIRELEYAVYRALLQPDLVNTLKSEKFVVKLDYKWDSKDIVGEYAVWLKNQLGSIEDVMKFLDISKPTFYRITKNYINS